MQTTTQRPAKARSQATKRPVYPRYPDTEHPGFWLAVLLCKQCELDEIQVIRRGKGFSNKSDRLQSAMWSALSLMREDMKLALGYVVEEGLLPFAHAHTTYFDQQVAA